jgi:glycogen synthase
MPSRYQPGGLGQLIARYGPVPLVRATHRFAETVRESWEGNGFHFHAYETSMVADMIARCLITFRDAPS